MRRSRDRRRRFRLSGAAVASVTAAFTVAFVSSTAGHPRTISPRAAAASASSLPADKALGQLIIATYAGPTPPAAILRAVRAGQVGSIILMGDDTTLGAAATRQQVDKLQAAARVGGNPGLLVMTDQEGGTVKRFDGPPFYSASKMSLPELAQQQGIQTGLLLRKAGVNVDLAPVADVSLGDGFMTQEQRTFGNSAEVVAEAACAFAQGLASERIGYTLKHFPGLGAAATTTDLHPVSVSLPAAEIFDDDLAYRRCGHGPLASVMISSASYTKVTGSTPAVLSPITYDTLLRENHVSALTMSDSFESGAIDQLQSPAMTAIKAGLDMVMYPNTEAASADAYPILRRDVAQGLLPLTRVVAAAQRVLALKRALGLVQPGAG